MTPACSTTNIAHKIGYKLPANTPREYLMNGTFLFTAKGCAVTERQTTQGKYIYSAINLISGAEEVLSFRKVTTTTSSGGLMLGPIRARITSAA